MAVADPSEQLAWEARTRPRAALIAGLAGLLMIAGLVLFQLNANDQPQSLLLDSLRTLEEPGAIGEQPTAQTPALEYERDNLAVGIGSRLMFALGLLGIGLVIAYLGACTRARRPALNRFGAPSAAVGGAIIGIALVILYVAQLQLVDNVLDGAGTVDEAREAPGIGSVGSVVLLLGFFVFAFGGLLVCLNAMRAGLLTRTMGIIGMFATVSPMLLGPIQPLLPLWTLFLVPLFLGRWMGGQPPAWETGQEEPWPSAAELREERLRAKGRLAEPDPEPVEEKVAARAPHPSSKKRKRKRRS